MFLVLVVTVVVAALFAIPLVQQGRRVSAHNPVMSGSMTANWKPDDPFHADYTDYFGKPKRVGQRYLLTEDGEVVLSNDDTE